MASPDTPIEVTMPPGSVVITPAQMYAEVRTMGGKLDHLIAVVDPAFSSIREDLAQLEVKHRQEVADRQADVEQKGVAAAVIHNDHEARLRSIEKRMYVFAGAAAAGGAGLSQLLPLIGK